MSATRHGREETKCKGTWLWGGERGPSSRSTECTVVSVDSEGPTGTKPVLI